MNRTEMREASSELKKQSNKFMVKALTWAFVGGMALKGLLLNYARSSNCTCTSSLLDTVLDKDLDQHANEE